MKVILDVNVLFVSISRRSAHHPILKAFEEKRYELFVTTDILLEYEEIIGGEMGRFVASTLLRGIQEAQNVRFINKYFFWKLIAADPDDNKYVDCAVAGNVDFIVTDDRHFRVLSKTKFPKVRVISADDFVEMLTGIRPEKRK